MTNIPKISLFAWGANSHGQLAIGVENEMEVLPVEVDTSFLEAEILQISGGGGHTLILDTAGRVYSCGWNSRGQLGIGNQENTSRFVRIPQSSFLGKRIRSVACGWDNSGAVTEDGELFVWGSNKFGQLGMQDTGSVSQLNIPRKVCLPDRVLAVDFGLRHLCIVAEGGTIYLAGKSKCLTAIEDKSCSQKFGGFLSFSGEKIVKIATGQHHFLYQIHSGEINTLGDNKFNQLADDSLKNFASETVDLKSGWTHSGLLTKSGKVFLWGRNVYGQIGQIPEGQSVATPTELAICDVREFHLGSEHGLCVSMAGDVFTWGWNEHGNCGNGSTKDVFKPQKVNLPGKCAVAGVGAGFCFTAV
ncbi:secretion-regulating guanine nucleotide exchange factor [Phlebotomus papatasi]|uniref:secretion-regulating guanine nucleotide exchange factor n=1 Tax=Phlebotomus papatasi TaxID=29031 RepID=UPI0024840436|nr:secretion-regulating guanine nucleotide exchange factor [Phlebotomus papatasi]